MLRNPHRTRLLSVHSSCRKQLNNCICVLLLYLRDSVHVIVACASNEIDIHNFLEFWWVPCTYMTSLCTQGPPRPGFCDAKCSSKFHVLCNCLDSFLFQQRRKLKFLEFLTLPDRAQSMNRPNKTHSLCWHLHGFKTLLLAAAAKPFSSFNVLQRRNA